ncbi:MAG: hypothetical protein AAGB51_07205 [Planctomycetota bacterium]
MSQSAMDPHAVENWSEIHSHDRPQDAHLQQVNPQALIVVLIVTLVFVAVFVGVTVVYYNHALAAKLAEKTETTTSYREYAATRATANSRLETAGVWTTPDPAGEGVIRKTHIPIDRAMRLVAQESN